MLDASIQLLVKRFHSPIVRVSRVAGVGILVSERIESTDDSALHKER